MRFSKPAYCGFVRPCMVKFKRNFYRTAHIPSIAGLSRPGSKAKQGPCCITNPFPPHCICSRDARAAKRGSPNDLPLLSLLTRESRDRRDNDLLNFDQDRSSLGNICVTRILESRTPVGEKSECMFLVLSCLREQHLSGSNATHLRFDFDILLLCCVLKFHTESCAISPPSFSQVNRRPRQSFRG